MRTTASCCQRPFEVLGEPLFWGEAAAELPLKLGCWVVLFLFYRTGACPVYLFGFVLKRFAVGRVVGGSNLALAFSLPFPPGKKNVLFSCPAVHGAAWLGSDVAEGMWGHWCCVLVFW